jgi:CheY-like chemotaxis protein
VREVMAAMIKDQKILLVDDEPDLTTVFSMGLEDNGFKVDAFNDPLLALSEFKKGSYDLILLDDKMPNMNGFELYTEIRKIELRLPDYAYIKTCNIVMYVIITFYLEPKNRLEHSIWTP